MTFADILSVAPQYGPGFSYTVTGSIQPVDEDTVEIELSRPFSSVAVDFMEDTSGVEQRWLNADGSFTAWSTYEVNRPGEGATVAGYVGAGTTAVFSNPSKKFGSIMQIKRQKSGVEVTEEKVGEGGRESYNISEYQTYTNTTITGVTYSGTIRYRRLDPKTYLIVTNYSDNWPLAQSYSTRSKDADLDDTLESEYQKMVDAIDSQVADEDRIETERQRVEEAQERVEEAEELAEETGQSVTADDSGELVLIPEIAQNFTEVSEGEISPFSRLQTDSPLSPGAGGTYFVRSPLTNTASEAGGDSPGGSYLRLTVARDFQVQLALRVASFPQSGEDLSEDFTLNMYGGDVLEVEWKGSDTPPTLRATIDGQDRLGYQPYAEAPGRFELAGASIALLSASYTGTGTPPEGSKPSQGGEGSQSTGERSQAANFAILGLLGLFVAFIVYASRRKSEDE